jgi:hypothetical protein
MEIITTERVDIARHKRLAANVIAPDATDDALQALAERLLRRERVGTVILFVWSSPDSVGQEPYDVARVQIAKGKKRWTGDGRWLAGTPKAVPERVNRLRRERTVIERRDRLESS